MKTIISKDQYSSFKLVNKSTLFIPNKFSKNEQLKRILNINNFHKFNTNLINPKLEQRLKPGGKYEIQVYEVVDDKLKELSSVESKINSEIIMAFMIENNVLLTGAEGLGILYEMKPEILSIERWNLSFDYFSNLYFQNVKQHCVPGIYRGVHDDYAFMPVKSFEHGFPKNICSFICFKAI